MYVLVSLNMVIVTWSLNDLLSADVQTGYVAALHTNEKIFQFRQTLHRRGAHQLWGDSSLGCHVAKDFLEKSEVEVSENPKLINLQPVLTSVWNLTG